MKDEIFRFLFLSRQKKLKEKVIENEMDRIE